MSQPNQNRRRFIATLGVGSAAAAVVTVRQQGAPQVKPEAAAGSPGSGYRLTEHVRKYYESAKV